ncbi:MAG: site-specific integrase, partial [Paracoccaceae bacterium]
DRDPADVPADPLWLRPRLGKIAPAALGLSQKTWTNLLSDFRAALAVASATDGGRGRSIALPPEWAQLRVVLTEKRHRIGLSRFMQFCANLGVAPEAVNDDALAGFHAALARSELRKDPETLVRDVATFWNQARETAPEWPAARLTVPDRRNRVALAMETFSLSFRADVDAYLERLAASDLTDPDAPARACEPETIAFRRGQIARFASALVHRGRDPNSINSLADLVEPAAARAGLRYFLDRNGGKTSGAIYNLAALLKSVAKWHVHVDPVALDSLKDLARRVAPRNAGMTPKNRARLRQFDEGTAIGELLALPDRLIAKAGRARSPRAAALDIEIALAISILIHCPMRIENLRTLSLERHLSGRAVGPRRIVVPAEEVKNGMELDFPLPTRVVKLLDLFVRDHRKILNPDCGDLLFAKRGAAEPVAGGALGQRISRAIRRETGLEVNPHLFRHISAKIYLRANPGAFEVVKRLLGHSQTSSTIDVYAGFETDAATRAYAAILEQAAAAPRRRRRVRR